MRFTLICVLGIVLISGMLLAQDPFTDATNMLPNADLETWAANYWTPFGSGATMTWATDEAAQQSLRSFKVEKSGTTSDAVGWESDNNADLYWNNAAGNVLYTMNFWGKTMNVNTSPANNDEEIGLWYRFYAGGSLIAEQFVAVDQSAASVDWTEYSGTPMLVTSEPDEVVVTAQMGKDATGTVWFDNIGCGTDPWSMGIFNGDAETPEGWMNWASASDTGFANTVPDPDAHSGQYSVLLRERDTRGDEMVFYSEPVPATPGKWYAFSVWVKTDSINTGEKWYATNAMPDFDDQRLGICFFFHRTPLYSNWDLTGGDQFFYFDQLDSMQVGWKRYIVCAKAPDDAAGVSMRARFNPYPRGYVWYDDFGIWELDEQPNLLPNADLETWAANYWTAFGSGATMTWATDEAAQQSLRSFKVEKSGTTSDAVGWESDNNADLYWNNAAGNVLYTMNFWGKTMNVNTSPANNDEEIGLWYRFYAGGSLIAEQFVAVDQSAASVDWTEYSGTPMLVTSEPDEVVVTAQMGKDATGTVWFDNISCGTDPWSMGIFNGDAETPEGWMNWASASDTGFANTVPDPNAHSGQYSVLLRERDTRGDEMVFYSEPIPAEPEKWYKFSVWAKTDSVDTLAKWYPTSAIPNFDDQRLGICFFFHRDPLYTAWELTGGDQFFYFDQQPGHEFTDWTYYCVFAKSPGDASGMSMRARFNPYPRGYVWYDDFAIEDVHEVITIIEDQPTNQVTVVPTDFELKQNYPNPFNPETIIEYLVPENGLVELNIYNVLGQKVRTLVNDVKTPGTYQVLWDGRDDSGNRLATGMYIYQLRGKNAMITKRMIFVK